MAAAASSGPSMVTQATSPISPNSPLISNSRRTATAPAAAKKNKNKNKIELDVDDVEDDIESLTSNEAMLDNPQFSVSRCCVCFNFLNWPDIFPRAQIFHAFSASS